jgi:hypothetical protein
MVADVLLRFFYDLCIVDSMNAVPTLCDNDFGTVRRCDNADAADDADGLILLYASYACNNIAANGIDIFCNFFIVHHYMYTYFLSAAVAVAATA